MPVELLLEVGLGIGSSGQLRHWNLELPAAILAGSDCRGSAEPFKNPESSLRHGNLVSHAASSFTVGDNPK